MIFLRIASLLFLLQPFLAKAESYLNLHQGYSSLGGKILLNLHITKGSDVNLNITIEPEVSYFFVERFETFLNVKLKLDILKTKDKEGEQVLTWGIGVGPRFYFTDSRFAPYIGASYSIELDNWRAESMSYRYSLEPGFLYGANPHLGMNFGLPISLNFTTHHHFKGLDLQTGLLGFKYISH